MLAIIQNLGTIPLLLEIPGIDVTAKSNDGETILMCAAKSSDDQHEYMRYLMDVVIKHVLS